MSSRGGGDWVRAVTKPLEHMRIYGNLNSQASQGKDNRLIGENGASRDVWKRKRGCLWETEMEKLLLDVQVDTQEMLQDSLGYQQP